jgi:hypothetical protein
MLDAGGLMLGKTTASGIRHLFPMSLNIALRRPETTKNSFSFQFSTHGQRRTKN